MEIFVLFAKLLKPVIYFEIPNINGMCQFLFVIRFI